MTMLTDEEQDERREWFRQHYEQGVAFNRRCGLRVLRWDPDGVEITIPYADDLSAHEGIFHGGVVSALIDTSACGAVMAGHDFDNGSRATTISMTVQYLSLAPGEDLVARARCVRRGRRLQFSEVSIHSGTTDKLLAHGVVSVNVSGERAGAPTSRGEEDE